VLLPSEYVEGLIELIVPSETVAETESPVVPSDTDNPASVQVNADKFFTLKTNFDILNFLLYKILDASLKRASSSISSIKFLVLTHL
jgi:hypothetical protein